MKEGHKLIKTYSQDGHGIVVGGDDDDAGILAQRGFEVAYENAEKRDDAATGRLAFESKGASQCPSVLLARFSRQQRAGQKIQLR